MHKLSIFDEFRKIMSDCIKKSSNKPRFFLFIWNSDALCVFRTKVCADPEPERTLPSSTVIRDASRSRNFAGEQGGEAHLCHKKDLTTLFPSSVYLFKKNILFLGSGGNPTSSGGGGGSNCLFHIGTHIFVILQGGSVPTIPLLWFCA